MTSVKFFLIIQLLFFTINTYGQLEQPLTRERIKINEDWRFFRYYENPDTLIYDDRPNVKDKNDDKVADTKASVSEVIKSSSKALKKWILPTANDFIKDTLKWHYRPQGNPGESFSFVNSDFNDQNWESVNLPHDWAIDKPFYQGEDVTVGGGMGRLPIQGVGWYRKKLQFTISDEDKSIYLDIDGAMSYSMVWLNGYLVGGWPYGYNSFRLDLTPYINFGRENQLAIRLDNPNYSSRWYPGGGIYRNVWLVKTNRLQVAHYGTFITAKNISAAFADLDLRVTVQNKSSADKKVKVETDVYFIGTDGKENRPKIASFPTKELTLPKDTKEALAFSLTIKKPKLWGPGPQQKPNLYKAVTKLISGGKIVDQYETTFGMRNIKFDAERGVLVNGQPIRIQGVNQHHDLGALGAAFNIRAAKRQLEILRDMGTNAIRMAHNPPAPELLDLTDQMGFLVINEIFDSWERGKTPHDFHLIFSDWYEPDLRSFIRRDRNHPSIIAWSFGNEVGEQYLGEEGAQMAKELYDIVKEEDSTRPATASMNYAKPDMPFSGVMDLISLNYQGEGIRDAPAYAHLKGIKTPPLYPAFREEFPDKLIFGSETASTLSTRGTYIFPVTDGVSAPVNDTTGGDPDNKFVSAYELYTSQFGASPDKVFASQDKYPYVAGEFVWSGFDYLGEPTPYYSARSSYSGIIDLAGFKKDRFYLYQSRWRPEYKMAHILPHWNWPDRVGKITPVHVFTSGDEGELFLNDKSLGKKKKKKYEYRLRWDNVVYEPGELKVITYKNGEQWVTETVHTTGAAASLQLSADRDTIKADGSDLSFVTIEVLDGKGRLIPDASNTIKFEVEGAGEIVATDNGNPADMASFTSHERKALAGKALVIIRSRNKLKGTIRVKVFSDNLQPDEIMIKTL